MAFARAATVSDVWEGEPFACRVSGKPVLLVRFGADVVAYADRCAHLGFALSKGKLEGHVLTCGAHHWSFDARSGAGLNPRDACLVRYPVRLEGDDVFVDVELRAS
ncbi:Toluene-4-monooxygenase, subunit TmoC [Labilithrix luteola]|uniref:Toluene-4-monooxygenase, subunit TmoC n=1 Tax=Labilithrix luteola TaxID=1391654 RepID=A0A0K1PLG7_9BACT|nr:Rieske 2Fe-2S domain-containing protein [Labilithrix luteola]AKU94378.1 Toluene-4-monooxygenase, subunit TmoC [Labilithrix luteola]